MKHHHITSSENTEINITPMLDVVFIILIFFIVTTSFTKHTGLKLSNSNGVIFEKKSTDLIAITINSENSININGQHVKLNNASSFLAHIKATNPEVKAQVLAAEDISTGTLVKTLDHVYANKIKLSTVNTL